MLLWLCLISARAIRLAAAARRARERRLVGDAFVAFFRERDWPLLLSRLEKVRASSVAEAAARALPLLAPERQVVVGAALARRRIGAFVERARRSAVREVRVEHCELLRWIPGPRPVRLLREALADRSSAVRLAAAIALVERGAAPGAAELFGALGARACRMARTAQLVDLLLPAEMEALAAIAADEAADPQLRSHISAALENAQPEQEGLPQDVQDADPAGELPLLRSPEAASPALEPVLRRLLASAFAEVRREAADRAAELGATALLPVLLDLMRDPDPAVSAAAARAAWSLSPSSRSYIGEAPPLPAGVTRIHGRDGRKARAS